VKLKSLNLKDRRIRHAVHEVGHAVMGLHLGKRVSKLNIHSVGMREGICTFDARFKGNARERLLIGIGGIASCYIYGDKDPGVGAEFDEKEMVSVARFLWGNMPKYTALNVVKHFYYVEAVTILLHHRTKVRKLALELARKGELKGTDVMKLWNNKKRK